MELHGFKSCLQFLLNSGIKVGKFVTDRHTAISKFMEEKHPEISHRYDIWHVAKSKFNRDIILAYHFI